MSDRATGVHYPGQLENLSSNSKNYHTYFMKIFISELKLTVFQNLNYWNQNPTNFFERNCTVLIASVSTYSKVRLLQKLKLIECKKFEILRHCSFRELDDPVENSKTRPTFLVFKIILFFLLHRKTWHFKRFFIYFIFYFLVQIKTWYFKKLFFYFNNKK